MKSLLRAAISSRRHLALMLCTLFALFGMTMATQCEMFAIGLMTDASADFFTLFGGKNRSVSWEEVTSQWDKIDVNGSGTITPQDAATYIRAQAKQTNPLQWAMAQVQGRVHLESHFWILILVLVFVAVFKAVWLFCSRYLSQLLSVRISRDLRQRYFDHIQLLPMSFYQRYNIGALSSRVVGDANQIASSLNSIITNFLQMPLVIISTLALCFYLSWQLSLVIFFGAPMILLPVMLLARRVKRVSRQLLHNQERFTSVLIDFLAGIETVKIFSMEPFSRKKYEEQNGRMAHLEAKAAKYSTLTRPILHMITTACLAVIVLFGLQTLHMKVSDLIVFCGLLHMLYEPVKKLAEENTNMQRGIVAAERMYEVLNIQPEITDMPGAIDLKEFRDRIEFDRVWFRYQDEWVLKNLSFTVHKGQTVAIIGPTGAGKSTIVQLIPRLFAAQQGQIRIDGIPLERYRQRSLREHMGFVSQRPFLFYDTVAANICYGREYTRQEMAHAAQRAHAEEFILRLPGGYDAMLAEGGQNLSGGQQQRLAIARALVKKAPILIFDEATSSLDSISENRLKTAITGLHGHITQILIAHRLSTVEHADKIVYIENGEKIAEGTKEELMATCAPFRTMWEAHFSMHVSEV